MKDRLKIIDDKEAIRSFTQETRNKILSILRARNKTVPQIAETLDSDTSTVYRHIKELEEHDFIKKVGERHEEGRPKHVYARTAELFLMLPDYDEIEQSSTPFIDGESDDAEKVIAELRRSNKNFRLPDQAIEDFSSLFKEIEGKLIEDMEREGSELDNPDMIRIAFILFLFEIGKNEELESKLEDFLE